MKKYKKIIIVALCVALLLSMCSVSAFAAEETVGASSPVMPIDDEAYIYYVPAGWSFYDFTVNFEFALISCMESDSTVFQSLRISNGSLYAGSLELDSSDDFLLVSLVEVSDFSAYRVDLDLFWNPFYVSEGWSVPSGYFYDSVFEASFVLNGISYSDAFAALGYSYDNDYVAASDSFVVYGDFPLVIDNSESFTLQFDLYSSISTEFFYFLLHNGEVVEPLPESESLTNDLFSVFGSVGSWISGAASSLVDMFWDGSSLTFVGILSVSALALSVIFLVLSFIERFLRFGG